MGYTLDASQKAALLDENGQPILVTDLTDAGGVTHPPFVGPVGSILDDGTGHVEFVANAPGSISLTFTQPSSGTPATHTVTVAPAPFDWTLGTPVAK